MGKELQETQLAEQFPRAGTRRADENGHPETPYAESLQTGPYVRVRLDRTGVSGKPGQDRFRLELGQGPAGNPEQHISQGIVIGVGIRRRGFSDQPLPPPSVPPPEALSNRRSGVSLVEPRALGLPSPLPSVERVHRYQGVVEIPEHGAKRHLPGYGKPGLIGAPTSGGGANPRSRPSPPS